MKRLLSIFAVTTSLATPTLANESDFPAESVSIHDGTAFSVNIPDVECAVSNYLDIPLD